MNVLLAVNKEKTRLRRKTALANGKLHALEYTTYPDRYTRSTYFYKYAFAPVTPGVARRIVGHNLVLADAAFSITGNRR
jgi:hypothetical protein